MESQILKIESHNFLFLKFKKRYNFLLYKQNHYHKRL